MGTLYTAGGRALPPLGFGFMRLPLKDEADRSAVALETVKEMVDLYMARGFGYFDTAHRYHDGASESALRQAVTERYPRERFWLADKLTRSCVTRPEELEPFFRRQLALCGVEWFDLYLIHNVGRLSLDAFEALDAFGFLESLRERGLARHTGFSFHGTADVLEEVLRRHPDTEFVQLQLNYLDWEDAAIQSRACYETARRYGCRIVVMEPVKGGTLVNLPEDVAAPLCAAAPQASLASWAIRFAAGLDGVDMVLSGMSTPEQLRDNTSFMAHFRPLSPAEQALLAQAADRLRAHPAIACTACRYCTAGCPEGIAIPDCFQLYSNYKRLENTAYMYNQKTYYANLTAAHGRASACIGCGRCEESCPQGLPIRALLKQVAAVLE